MTTTTKHSNGRARSAASKMPKGIKNLGEVETVTCWVAPAELHGSAFNPEARTITSNLRGLKLSMQKFGFLPFFPIVADFNGVIMDGHRRQAAAMALGMDRVTASIVDIDGDKLWAEINSTQMPITGGQVMEALTKGLQTIPPKWGSQIERLRLIVGQEGVDDLGRRGVSPSVAKQAMQIGRYLDLETDIPFLAITVYWLVNHKHMSVIVRRAISEQVDPAVIQRCIRADRPMRADYRPSTVE